MAIRKYQSNRTLKRHQRHALVFVRKRRGQAGLFMAPGTGKTLVAIRYAEEVITDREPGLILCRRDDYLTWKLELMREGVPEHEIMEIDSGKFEPPRKQPRYTIVSYDLTKNPTILNYIRANRWAICVADECQYIKRWKSRRTKKVISATRHINRRIGSTGTHITNEVEDVFSQCLFIDNGRTFGADYWRFKTSYYTRSGPGWFRRRNARKRIEANLKHLAYVVHEDDVLDLPPQRSIVKGAPMRGAQRREYERLLDGWEYKYGDELIEVEQVVVQVTKLLQLTSGFLYHKEKGAKWFKSGKLDLLESLLKPTGELGEKPKIVVWCSFKAEIERIAQLSADNGWGHVTFSGGPRRKKEQARLAFANDPKCRLFIGQVDSGVGMNELVVADTAVYYSNSTKVVSREQSRRRTRRIGSEQHKEILYYDLIVEGSIDEKRYNALMRKADFADLIMNELRTGRTLRDILTS